MTAYRFVMCLVIACCASLAVRADDAEIKKIAKSKATECQNSLLKGDYDTFVNLTHPKVVEGNGGPKKMIEAFTTEMKKWKKDGFEFKSVMMSDPTDTVLVGKELYICVPFTLEITAPIGRIVSKGALVGISNDEGKSWTFIDTAPGRTTLKKLFPDLPEKLEIPKKEPPMILKD